MDTRDVTEAIWLIGGIGLLGLVLFGWYLAGRIYRSVRKIEDITGYVQDQEEQKILNRL